MSGALRNFDSLIEIDPGPDNIFNVTQATPERFTQLLMEAFTQCGVEELLLHGAWVPSKIRSELYREVLDKLLPNLFRSRGFLDALLHGVCKANSKREAKI